METMTQSNRNSIEKYLDLYRRDPDSKVFAPLAEAYRKNGQIEHALDIALKGVRAHPEFASGRMTLGRIYMAQNLWPKAISELKHASELNPELLLAHKLLGECYLETGAIDLSLQAFKMALYLDPLDEKAKAMTKKLETLKASPDYEDQKDHHTSSTASRVSAKAEMASPVPLAKKTRSYEVDRYATLIDAHIARRDFTQALESIEEAINKLGPEPEFLRRRQYVEKRFQGDGTNYNELKNDVALSKKIAKLRMLQDRIEERRILS